MFDRTIIENGGPSRVDHHYHKPSTADDLRLLREMRLEVEAEFRETKAPDNCMVNVRMFRSEFEQRTFLCLKLNGRDVSVKVNNDELLAEKSGRAVVNVIARAIAEQIGFAVVMKATEIA